MDRNSADIINRLEAVPTTERAHRRQVRDAQHLMGFFMKARMQARTEEDRKAMGAALVLVKAIVEAKQKALAEFKNRKTP